MHLRYFIVDAAGQLRRVSSELIEAAWRGESSTRLLGCPLGDEFRLVSVLCDDENLQPQLCFFLRVSLDDGQITDVSRIRAYEAMTRHANRRYDSVAARHQLAGWPIDWQRQLAVALDVPAMHLRRIGIGGPLLMSDLWGISIPEVIEYFERATGG